jgi:tetratricopeptide (TPR) repeat protein/cold shock CspA family protein
MDLPLPLRTAMESGGVTLFVGAGICHNYLTGDGRSAPDGEELARRLAKHIGLDPGPTPNLSKVAQLVEQRKDRATLEKLLIRELTDLEPDDTLVWLFSKTWRAIYTTNYDRIIQRAYELVSEPTQEPISFTASRDVVWVDPRFQVGVFHLHGSLFEGEHRSALITVADYARFREQRSMLFDLLKQSFATSPILYIGYSNQDPNWETVRSELEAEFAPSKPPEAYRMAPTTNTIDEEVLRGQGVTTLSGTLDDFRTACERDLPGLRVVPCKLEALRATVPPALAEAFESAPAAVARLVKNWSYVSQEDFSSPGNTTEFLRGDAPNWPAVAQGVPFERDIEEPLFESLLDAATDPEQRTRSSLMLGPAGYGTTTALRRLAVRLADDQVGSILWHRQGAQFLAADVEFAASALPPPLFFVVDNASDASDALTDAVAIVRERRRHAHFLLGDRLNEWRQRRLRLRPREWSLEALSESEIPRLISCLAAHHALGVLEELPENLQFAAVREKHGKELLVAMREATSGLGFDAIVEDEYWSLATDEARQIYGLVAALYRSRAVARVGLLSAVLGMNPVEIYQHANEELEGVVLFETIDEDMDITIARPRHHVIADMVWSRCLGSADRERFLLSVIRALNLNYPADAQAFDRLVRADDAVDEIADLERRIEFFQRACKKDPASGYVRQHFARMLRRAGELDAALEQVQLGLDLGGRRVLHHTKGVILSDLAMKAASPELGRRRLIQAEQAFRKVLSINPKDQYGFHGLAELYFHWATRAPTPDEQAEYLAKCEKVISEGLSLVAEKEGLWIVSAAVAEYMDDAPGVIEALERAVSESSDAVIARYLLARKYFESGNYQQVIVTLMPVLESHPDQYRSGMLCARAIYRMGGSLREAAAILNLGSLAGERDPWFIALSIGLHFVAGNHEEVERLRRVTEAAGFPVGDQHHVSFVTEDGGVPTRLSGSVLRLRAGYAFLRVEGGLPDIFCPGRELGALELQQGDSVTFELGFSPRGPVARHLARA